MRFLSFHCDHYWYQTTEKSRSPLLEELNEQNKEGKLEDVLVLLISVEKEDESNPEILKESLKEVENIIDQIQVSNFVLLSFAHLFGRLSSPRFALDLLKKMEKHLKSKNYKVLRPPFGWFNEFELKAKGHPLSRMSRRIMEK